MTRLLDTVAGVSDGQLTVSRSRFVATLAPASDEQEAAEVVTGVRRRWHDARHHASAVVLGPRGDRTRSSDDGEPAGTAGAPMLAVLEGAGLSDVVAVVTRWFGGTLLGAGGLVRAYGGALAVAVERAERLHRRELTRVELTTDHATAGRLEHRLHGWVRDRDAQVLAGRYGPDGACFELRVAPEQLAACRAWLAELALEHQLEVIGSAVTTWPAGRAASPGPAS